MTYPNGVATTYEYDPASRLTRLSAHKGATVITDFNYTYDAVDNRTQKATPELIEDYKYDRLSQLTDVNRTGTGEAHWAYRYDKAGNRTAEQADGAVTSGTHDNMNRLLSKQAGGALLFAGSVNEPATVTVQGAPAGAAADNTFGGDATVPPGTSTVDVQATDASGNVRTNTYEVTQGTGTAATYTYDANGNLETKVEGGSAWSYEWNALNELTRVTKDAVEIAAFAYDPRGRRVEKIAGGVTASYTYDAEGILREVLSSGTMYTYVHGAGIDEPLARDRANVLTYYQVDGLGSVVSMTDAAGAVASTRRYDAYGGLQVGATDAGFAFTGREWDPETGLYYYRARYYDARIGRFISEDPIAFEGGWNFYAYVENDPISLIDPEGLEGLYPVVECTGENYQGKGHLCCKNGQLAICIPENIPEPNRRCLIKHEEEHAVACPTTECAGKKCEPLAFGEPAVTNECRPSRMQYQCLTDANAGRAAKDVKGYAESKRCDTTKPNWPPKPSPKPKRRSRRKK